MARTKLMANSMIFLVVFSILSAISLAESSTPVGTFSVGNSLPPAPYAWTPSTTHSKLQAFSWTEGTDDNGDPISTYICISADQDDDSCDVVSTNLTADPSYTFTLAEPNWDYTWGADARNYYVNLTPNDGNGNGTANVSISYTLTDALPTLSGQTSDSSNDGDKDVGETINFSTSHTDTDASDNHSMRICKTDSINQSGECPGGEYCNEYGGAYSDDSSLGCTYVAQQSDATSNSAYFFVCDCPAGDDSCPGQCSASYSHTFYVNHIPSASDGDVIPNSPTSSQTLNCTYTFADTDTDSEGTSTYRWFKDTGSGYIDSGITTMTVAPENTAKDDVWMCEVTPVDQHDLVGFAINSSNETITNNAPDQPSGLQIQDGATSWDSSSLDTHDKTPNLQWNTSDADGDDVTTYVCIATTSGNRDSNNCDAHSSNTSTDAVSDVTGLDYSGINRTYYLRLTPNDGEFNGTVYDSSFNLLNVLPTTPSGMSPTETHSQTPDLSWTAIDADDGSVDHWPADSLTYHIRVGTIYGDGTYDSNDNANKAGEAVDSAIPWGVTGAAWANNTVYVSIWTTDGNTGGTSDYYNNTIVLYDNLPDITDVEITDANSVYSSCVFSTCALTPIEASDSRLAARVTVNDTDNDCDTSATAYLYFCLDTGSCSPGVADYNWQVDSASRTGSECTYVFSTNKTSGTPEFFHLPNSNYTLYVNASSQAGQRTSDSERTASWQYDTIKAINYPSLVTFSNITTLGQWNDGTNIATMTNQGNDVLNIEWYLSNPSSGSDIWTLTGEDIQIDDDNSQAGEGSGYLSPVYMNQTAKTFEPGTGLEVCSSSACSDGALNETLETYFHILPPLGLLAGTYNTTITISIS